MNLAPQILCKRYQVVAYIGSGGMAETYRAHDLQRGVDLAIKALRPELANDDAFIRRFWSEANALKNLDHPNIIRFYSFERDPNLGVFFIVMDYIEGATLREEMKSRGGRLDFQRILEVMRSLCSALDYAHKKGYIHRDVKPSNVLVGAGKVFLADFGIADSFSKSFANMEKIGSPGYMSPEQIRGEPASPASDIYSLGVMLFEMTTGVRPFRGDSPKTIGSTSERVRQEHLQLLPPSPRLYNPQISPQLERVILRCLEKSPAARFSSAGELMRALEEVIPAAQTLKPAVQSVSLPFRQKPQTPLKINPVSSFRRNKRAAITVWATLSVAILMLVLISIGNLSGLPKMAVSPTVFSAPVKASASAPTFSAPSFFVRPYNPSTDKNIASIWDAIDFSELALPGKQTWQKNLSSGGTFQIGSGWCAKNATILEQNLTDMEFRVFIDKADVSDKLSEIEDWGDGTNLVCRVFFGVLSGLSKGTHQYTEILSMTEEIFDGEQTYPAGDYIYELVITVK